MPKNINSASRLHSLLSKTTYSHAPTAPVLDVWTKLFEINEPNTTRSPFLVSERLRWMLRELEFIAEQMDKLDFSKHLYVNAIANIQNAISSMILSGQWAQAQQYLGTDTLLSLDFCSEILPDEESAIAEDELSQIQELVNELRSSLSASELPPRLVSLIQHHIELIQQALAEYPITGAKALREAAHTGLGEYMLVKESIDASGDNPEISKLGALWKKVNTTADIALKAEKLLKLSHNALELLERMF